MRKDCGQGFFRAHLCGKAANSGLIVEQAFLFAGVSLFFHCLTIIRLFWSWFAAERKTLGIAMEMNWDVYILTPWGFLRVASILIFLSWHHFLQRVLHARVQRLDGEIGMFRVYRVPRIWHYICITDTRIRMVSPTQRVFSPTPFLSKSIALTNDSPPPTSPQRQMFAQLDIRGRGWSLGVPGWRVGWYLWL